MYVYGYVIAEKLVAGVNTQPTKWVSIIPLELNIWLLSPDINPFKKSSV